MFKGRPSRGRNDEALPVTEADEEQLLAKAMQFDDAALGELYDRYEARIYGYIYRRTGDQILAEDLTAQVLDFQSSSGISIILKKLMINMDQALETKYSWVSDRH